MGSDFLRTEVIAVRKKLFMQGQRDEGFRAEGHVCGFELAGGKGTIYR